MVSSKNFISHQFLIFMFPCVASCNNFLTDKQVFPQKIILDYLDHSKTNSKPFFVSRLIRGIENAIGQGKKLSQTGKLPLRYFCDRNMPSLYVKFRQQ